MDILFLLLTERKHKQELRIVEKEVAFFLAIYYIT
jgi:hypothetical protein